MYYICVKAGTFLIETHLLPSSAHQSVFQPVGVFSSFFYGLHTFCRYTREMWHWMLKHLPYVPSMDLFTGFPKHHACPDASVFVPRTWHHLSLHLASRLFFSLPKLIGKNIMEGVEGTSGFLFKKQSPVSLEKDMFLWLLIIFEQLETSFFLLKLAAPI